MELLLGCGNSTVKHVKGPDDKDDWNHLIRLDIDPDCKPDVLHDLNVTPWPFDDAMFDEVHAYEVLEHLGRQGDYKSFFAHFSEIWRILKPEGRLYATTPMWDSEWAWGDPGHTRVITPGSLVFLNQTAYDQVGSTHMTDYRSIYKADFECVGFNENEGRMGFVLRARK